MISKVAYNLIILRVKVKVICFGYPLVKRLRLFQLFPPSCDDAAITELSIRKNSTFGNFIYCCQANRKLMIIVAICPKNYPYRRRVSGLAPLAAAKRSLRTVLMAIAFVFVPRLF